MRLWSRRMRYHRTKGRDSRERVRLHHRTSASRRARNRVSWGSARVARFLPVGSPRGPRTMPGCVFNHRARRARTVQHNRRAQCRVVETPSTSYGYCLAIGRITRTVNSPCIHPNADPRFKVRTIQGCKWHVRTDTCFAHLKSRNRVHGEGEFQLVGNLNGCGRHRGAGRRGGAGCRRGRGCAGLATAAVISVDPDQQPGSQRGHK